MVFEYYTDFYKKVFTEEEYEKKRVQIYRYLMDVASDEIVPPPLISNSKKLGEERSQTNRDLGKGDGYFVEDYRNRKLMAYYLEPVAIKNNLSLEEARILLALSYVPEAKDRKELADFLEISEKHQTALLRKLYTSGYVKVKKKRGQEKLEITFLTNAEKILFELKQAEKEFENARFSKLTESELIEYNRLSEIIKENTLKIVF